MKIHHISAKEKRSYKTRIRIRGISNRVRLSIFRSNKYISAQLIDDKNKKTIVTIQGRTLKDVQGKKLTKTEKAKLVGQQIADTAKRFHIKEVVFDRGGYQYHGRIKALAEAARGGGLEF